MHLLGLCLDAVVQVTVSLNLMNGTLNTVRSSTTKDSLDHDGD